MQLNVKSPTDSVSAYAYTGGKVFDATLPCVVFIHGALHDHSVWTLLARWCAHHGHSVLAPDLPGHGRSAGMPLPSVQALADWLLELLNAVGVARAVLVGHSMGSLVALEAAARAPTLATHLVMIATAYPMKVSQALLSTARDAPLKAIDMVNAFSHSGWGAKPSFPGPGSWLHGANRALMRRVQAGQKEVNLFEHDFGVCDRYVGGLQAAQAVQCPTTFILGKQDQMTSVRQSRDLASALKADVHEVQAGHALMTEAPDAVLGALRAALG
jgi:pimeloyl-ACP methyl ester carboxylesterase